MNAAPAATVIASAAETDIDEPRLAERLVARVTGVLGDRRPQVALLLASAHFENLLSDLARETAERMPSGAMIGCTAEAVVCDDEEHENRPAVVLWAAYLPESRATAFHFSQADVERLESPEAVQEHLGVSDSDRPHFVVLADPFSIHPDQLVERLGEAYPGRPVFGGMASAGERAGQNRFVFDGETLAHGAVGMAIRGAVEIDGVVSQGCRPVAHPLVITRAERNVIYELGGKHPRQALQEVVSACTEQDVELARRRGMLIGRVIDEHKERFERGDFLIRSFRLAGNAEAIVVGDVVRAGQTVQFHVQDAGCATEDLETLLMRQAGRPAAGALLFTCNGRGTRLFRRRSHDARTIADTLGAIPVAGLFCAGEIGPIGSQNFLHGHTASIALFRPGAPPRAG